ncbi:Crp/Fnr family transcriptional regulator [Hydrogenimonas sp.]
MGADSAEKAIATLKESELFGAMTAARIADFLKEGKRVRYGRNDPIENDGGVEYFNVLLSGHVKLTQTDALTGRSVALFLLGPGDVFDIISLLDGEEHDDHPVSVDEAEIFRMPMARAREWVETEPALNERLLPYLGHRMRTLERFAASMVFDDTTTRLARLILHHTDTHSPTPEGHFPVRLANRLSHELMAEMIGSVRSVVTTQLKRLKEEELILQRRGEMAVRKLEELKKRYGL